MPFINPPANLTALYTCEIISRYHVGDVSRRTLEYALEDCNDEKKDIITLRWLIRAGVGGKEGTRNMRENLEKMTKGREGRVAVGC
jgi:hypothetical protein